MSIPTQLFPRSNLVPPAAKLHIQLFGRAHLRENNEPVKFKAPARVLSLLAYLIVHRAQAITRESLAFTLWPDELESSARSNLRRHLFTLSNDVLPPIVDDQPWILADKRTLQWNTSASYFCDLVAYLEAGESLRELETAIARYHGILLEGFDDAWLQKPREAYQDCQITRLHTLISAYQNRCEPQLALPYAKMLLDVDPWREESVRTLMTLFLQSGDRAKALQIYRDFARRLYEELSVAPMPETTALYTSIHEHSSGTAPVQVSLRPPSLLLHAASSPAGLTNAEALRTVASFTGRQKELSHIASTLSTPGTTLIIHGLGGTGKSALAREYARLHRDDYHIIWWLHAQSESDIIDGLIRLGSHLQPGLEQNPDRRHAAEFVLTQCLERITQPTLLIFDTIEDPMLLRRWTPTNPISILATSREATWSARIKVVPLTTWSCEDSLRFLHQELSDTYHPDSLRQLCEQLGFLPLALAHAAAYLTTTRTVTLERYLERLNEHLARAPRGVDYNRAVFATFSEAILTAEMQTPGAAALLSFASHFAPDSIPESLFTQPLDVYPAHLQPQLEIPTLDLASALQDPLYIDEILGTLHRLSLLAFSAETRSYTIHSLVQYVGRQLVSHQNTSWALAAVAAAHSAFPESEFTVWSLAERLITHARSALEFVPPATPSPTAANLARRCSSALRRRAEYQAAEPLARQSLALSQAAGDPAQALASLENLAGLLRETNRVLEAEPLYRQAIATLQTLDLAPSLSAHHLGSLTNGLGIVLHYSSRFHDAALHFQQALELAQATYDPYHPKLAIALSNAGLIFQEIDQRAQARDYLERALAIDEAAYGPDHPDVATDLCNLAWFALEAGQLDEAETRLKRALLIREATYGLQHPNFAYAVNDFAVVLHERRSYSDAERHHRQALAICQKCFGRSHPIIAAHLNALAQTLHCTGAVSEAEQCYVEAQDIDLQSLGPHHPNLARTLNNYAGLLHTLGRQQESRTALQQAYKSILERYGAEHPRTEAVKANLLRPPAERSWIYLRRSPSRGLRE